MKLLRFAVLFALLYALALGQAVSTSQINGTVQDSSGAAVSGAEIKATQTATGAVRTATSGSDGSYVLTNLPVGPYQLEVAKEGFTKYIQSGIVLQVASNPTIDATLKVGAVTEQVLVQADAAMVETHSTGVGQVVDEKRVVDLPLNGRQVTDLVFLSGAAVVGVNGDTQTSGKNYPVATISVGGGRSDGITFLLDGGSHNDPSNSENLPLPFPDAVQEFKVETSALSAQYGQHSAAAVNVVSKSGSNAFHGDLFEFLRNGDLNARNFFAPYRDMLKRNQFGGTVGGPIKKNKLFFFAGYQGTIQRSTPINSVVTIPTPQMMNGDFTTFASAACNNGVAKTLRGGFVNNILSPSLFSQPAVNLLKLYPTTTNPCGLYQFGLSNNEDEHQGIARVDYQLSDKHSIFARYYATHLLQPVSPVGNNILLSAATGTEGQDQSLVVGDTYLISSNTVSSFRMTGIRTMVSKITPSAITANDLGVQNLYSLPGSHQTSISFSGLPGIGTVIASGSFPTVAYQLNEDLSMVHGAHQFGFGANFIRAMMNDYSTRFANGQFVFTGASTGVPYGDLLAGNVGTFQQGSPSVFQPRAKYIGLYAQDSWKATSRLTVNYGIRWEPLLPTPTEGGRLSVFQQDWYVANVHSTRFPNAPAGVLFPGDKEPNGSIVPDGISSPNWKNFAPRLGIAWDPKGDGKMTVRAAYGIFYDLPNIFWNNNVGYEAPWSGLVSLSGVPFANPYATSAGGNPFPYVFNNNSKFTNFAQYWNGTLTRHPNYMNQWNLSIQRQFGSDWLVTANYLGNEAVHLWNAVDLNPALIVPSTLAPGTCPTGVTAGCNATTNTNQRRQLSLLNPTQGAFYSIINSLYDGGTQSYNALLFSIQRRLSKGFTVQANYTYSHCIGENQVYEITSANMANPNNLGYDRGNCNTLDRRQLFNLSAVGETPKFNDRMMRIFASGWKLTGIVTAQTGNFVNVTTGTDSALNGQPTTLQRPNLIAASPYPATQSLQQWIAPSAFGVPTPGTFGNLGAGTILAPGSLNVNLALSRLFQIREGQRLEVRAEAFNAINRANFAAPTLTQNNALFGQITATAGASTTNISGSAGDPRILQFALKYYF